ncbi:MAG: DUF3343 domain-containing protein [Fusobacteriaceae bacterium]
MIKIEDFLLLSANSTHVVMKCDGILKDAGIACRVIPLPSEVSASCGLSIKTELESLEKIRNILEMENLNLDFYKVKKMGIKKIIEKIDQ